MTNLRNVKVELSINFKLLLLSASSGIYTATLKVNNSLVSTVSCYWKVIIGANSVNLGKNINTIKKNIV
jgi:hypothetical protein